MRFPSLHGGMRLAVIALATLAPAGRAPAATPLAIEEYVLNARNEFVVTATVPAGSRHAILEALVPAESPDWRPMMAVSLDASSPAVVEFRLPRGTAPTLLARVKAGPAATFPTPVLDDPDAVTVVPFIEGPTEARREEMLVTAGRQLMQWRLLSRAERQRLTADWIRAQGWPEVDAVIASPTLSSITIRLKDGSSLLLINKARPDEADLERDFPPGAPLPQAIPESGWGSLDPDPAGLRAPRMSATRGLPESRVAVCAFSLEADFANSGSAIGGWLDQKGYLTDYANGPKVEDVLNWFEPGPLGVLFWHAHGITYEDADGKHYYAIALSQKVNKDPGQRSYLLLRKRNEIGMAHSPEDGNQGIYTLTHRFIANRMKFAPHSVVVLDACDGANPLANLAFRSAGAGVFASWDAESGKKSNTTLERLFDRLLGTNERAPFSSPPERPFALEQVQQWMAEKGFDKDPTFDPAKRTPARLKFSYHHTHRGHILRPSIRNIDYDAGTAARTGFRLYGDFGKDQRAVTRVTWNGRPLQITDWHPGSDQPGDVASIAVDPGAAPYPVGDFKVEMRAEHESNEPPLTEWQVPFTYRLKGRGSLQYTILSDLRLRLDVHGFRGKPQDPVTYPAFSPFTILDDCTGTITASGTYHRDPPNGPVTNWSGTSVLRSYNPAGGHNGNNFITQLGYVNLNSGQVASFGYAAKGHYQQNGHTVDGGMEPMTTYLLMPRFNTTNWSFTGDTLAGDGSHVLDYGVSSTLTWPSATPINPPKADTER